MQVGSCTNRVVQELDLLWCFALERLFGFIWFLVKNFSAVCLSKLSPAMMIILWMSSL